MKSIESLKKNVKNKIFQSSNIPENSSFAEQIREPLSECQILDLQDKFLTNGFHCINVASINVGRTIIYRFLESLNCYHDNAALTVSDQLLDPYITDLYYDLVQGGYVDSSSHSDLEEFFLDQFYFDFLWIEASDKLMEESWFSEFFAKMINFKLDQHIPILVVSYCE